MRDSFRKTLSLLASGVLALSIGFQALAQNSADVVASALQHSDRPAADREDDARRMPQQVLTFAGIQRGMNVYEMEAGDGWYTEILARAVGADGSVIMQNPPAFDGFVGDAPQALAGRHSNVTVDRTNFDQLNAEDGSIDMVTWILGPHELWFEPQGNNLGDPAGSFAEIARILRDGGTLLMIDHHAAADAGPEVGGTLHRIGEGVVSDLAEDAGLSLVKSSRLHINPDDPLDIGVFDPAIQGQTSKFVLLYQK